MGKKHKKQIRNAFKDWDNVTAEDQMKNADRFFNINKNTVNDLGDLGLSDKVFVDKETGLEPEIVSDIINSFGPTGEENYIPDPDDMPDDVSFDDYNDDEAVPESVKRVLDSLENQITSEQVTDDEDESSEEGETEPLDESKEDNVEDDLPINIDKTEEADEDKYDYDDIRSFGCTVRSGLGIVKFDDGIAPFTLNEHVAMIENLAKDVDPSIINDDIIELFKKALIINRYPAAIYTKEEFISSNILDKGKFVQGESEHAVFVDVLNKYIAVYFVKNIALDRFANSITDIINVPKDEFGDPVANVWAYLGAILDTDRFSFTNDEDAVEFFYKSNYNEKELVANYLKIKYIDHSFDEDTEIDIIGRDSVENKFNYIIDIIISDDDDDDEEPEDSEDEEVATKPLTDNQEVLANALKKKAEETTSTEKKDDSMVIPVHHKEGKKQ